MTDGRQFMQTTVCFVHVYLQMQYDHICTKSDLLGHFQGKMKLFLIDTK